MKEKIPTVVLSIFLVIVLGFFIWGFVIMVTSDQPQGRRGSKYRHRTPATIPAATTSIDTNVKTAQ